jgi:hypothetical protein
MADGASATRGCAVGVVSRRATDVAAASSDCGEGSAAARCSGALICSLGRAGN